MAEILKSINGPYALAGLALLLISAVVHRLVKPEERTLRGVVTVALVVAGLLAVAGSLLPLLHPKGAAISAVPSESSYDGAESASRRTAELDEEPAPVAPERMPGPMPPPGVSGTESDANGLERAPSGTQTSHADRGSVSISAGRDVKANIEKR